MDPFPVELLDYEDPQANEQQALIDLLRKRQGQEAQERATLQQNLGRQQGQGAQLRSAALLTSLGQNPLLRGFQQETSRQAQGMDAMAARTEGRITAGGDPMNALLRLRGLGLAEKREQGVNDRYAQGAAERAARDRLKAAGAANSAAAKAEKAQRDQEKALFDVESKLRREVLDSPEGKDYIGARSSYKGIEFFVKNPSPASDMALVFGVMKTLDPTSVVKEGEQVQVRNTTNLPGVALNYLQKVQSGKLLDDEQREDLRRMAFGAVSAKAGVLKQRSDAYQGIIKGAGANPDNVMPPGFIDLNADAPPPQKGATQPAARPAPPKPAPNGVVKGNDPRNVKETRTGPDGKTYYRMGDGSWETED